MIDYESDRVKVTTWVGQEDGTVLAQEATLDGTLVTVPALREDF